MPTKLALCLAVSCLSVAPLFARSNPQVRCRVLALAGSKLKTGPWQSGAEGCAAVKKDAEFAAEIFGDTVIYKIQIRSAGRDTFVRLDTSGESDAKSAPVTLPRITQ
jgi:hypothetical protein